MSGDFEMIRINSGERTIIKMDGTELKDQVNPPKIEWCDAGEHYSADLEGGMKFGYFYDMIWICQKCRQS